MLIHKDFYLTKFNYLLNYPFEKLFLSGMIEHHQGAIQMVNMISNSANSEIKKFGESIVKTQSAEIEMMNELLKKLN